MINYRKEDLTNKAINSFKSFIFNKIENANNCEQFDKI